MTSLTRSRLCNCLEPTLTCSSPGLHGCCGTWVFFQAAGILLAPWVGTSGFHFPCCLTDLATWHGWSPGIWGSCRREGRSYSARTYC